MTIQEYAALLEKQEDLHPSLAPYIERSKALGWTMLRHPLVFSIPYDAHMNAMLNRQYTYKTEQLVKAKADGDWAKVLYLHERPYRLHALLEIMPNVTGTPFWELVSWVWTDTEAPRINRQVWRGLFAKAHTDPAGKALMDEGEQRALALMPATIQVWRGASAPEKRPSMSWTRDRERAVFFARRFHRPGAFLWTLQCPKERIVAFLNGRNEHEVIVLDAKGATKEE